MFITLSKQK